MAGRECLYAPTGPSLCTALPSSWAELWKDPDPTPLDWTRIRRASRRLADKQWLDPERRTTFAGLVGSQELRDSPIHRWFTYKEGFSPALPATVINALGLEGPLRVADAFGGVATTALAGQSNLEIKEVRSVEYSPFAQFVGRVKLSWPSLEPVRLWALLPEALAYARDPNIAVPDLAAFSNRKIFHRATLTALLSAREHLRELAAAKPVEREFFLLGLAAVIEDLSGAMKDGRALRVKGGRKRRPSSLADHPPKQRVSGRVKRALAGQWTAMIEDLETLAATRADAAAIPVRHLMGDARHLDRIRLDDGSPAFPDGWADLGCFSPPYLNCLDYTEVYKLELWLMEHITSQDQFRQTRKGTLRSHPSVRFEPRSYFDGESGPEIDCVRAMARWVCEQGLRSEVGRVIREYFEDMLQVWREQHRIMRAGGVTVCVVANSTFSRRESTASGERTETWRLPVLTDVLLGHLALRAGFASVQVWPARDLRPRNAREGRARESLVVAKKAP